MKSIVKRSVLIVAAAIALFAFSLPCFAGSDQKSGDKAVAAEFKVTAPRAVSAGVGVVLFATSEIAVYKHTDRE